MIKTAVAIHIRMINTGSKTSEITQIGAIWQEQTDFKSVHFHIKSPYKNSNGAVSLEEAISILNNIIKKRAIILFNNQGKEELVLRSAFNKFKFVFNPEIFDLSKKAKLNGIKKSNLSNLTKVYNVFRKNAKDLPIALYKAREVYLVGWKMFAEHE